MNVIWPILTGALVIYFLGRMIYGTLSILWEMTKDLYRLLRP